MKVYQRHWLEALQSEDVTALQKIIVLHEIMTDDTGTTDALTQAVAQLALELLAYKPVD